MAAVVGISPLGVAIRRTAAGHRVRSARFHCVVARASTGEGMDGRKKAALTAVAVRVCGQQTSTHSLLLPRNHHFVGHFFFFSAFPLFPNKINSLLFPLTLSLLPYTTPSQKLQAAPGALFAQVSAAAESEQGEFVEGEFGERTKRTLRAAKQNEKPSFSSPTCRLSRSSLSPMSLTKKIQQANKPSPSRRICSTQPRATPWIPRRRSRYPACWGPSCPSPQSSSSSASS